MASSSKTILARAGVVDEASFAIFSSGRSGDAQRMRARANRDFGRITRKAIVETDTRDRFTQPELATFIKEKEALRDERLRVATRIEKQVSDVRRALTTELAFRSRTQAQRDVDAARAAKTEEQRLELAKERTLRTARERQAAGLPTERQEATVKAIDAIIAPPPPQAATEAVAPPVKKETKLSKARAAQQERFDRFTAAEKELKRFDDDPNPLRAAINAGTRVNTLRDGGWTSLQIQQENRNIAADKKFNAAVEKLKPFSTIPRRPDVTGAGDPGAGPEGIILDEAVAGGVADATFKDAGIATTAVSAAKKRVERQQIKNRALRQLSSLALASRSVDAQQWVIQFPSTITPTLEQVLLDAGVAQARIDTVKTTRETNRTQAQESRSRLNALTELANRGLAVEAPNGTWDTQLPSSGNVSTALRQLYLAAGVTPKELDASITKFNKKTAAFEKKERRRFQLEAAILEAQDEVGAPLSQQKRDAIRTTAPFIDSDGVAVMRGIAAGVDPQDFIEVRVPERTVRAVEIIQGAGFLRADGSVDLEEIRRARRRTTTRDQTPPKQVLLAAGFSEEQIAEADTAVSSGFGGLIGRDRDKLLTDKAAVETELAKAPVDRSVKRDLQRALTAIEPVIKSTVATSGDVARELEKRLKELQTIEVQLDAGPLKRKVQSLVEGLQSSFNKEVARRLLEQRPRQSPFSVDGVPTAIPKPVPIGRPGNIGLQTSQFESDAVHDAIQSIVKMERPPPIAAGSTGIVGSAARLPAPPTIKVAVIVLAASAVAVAKQNPDLVDDIGAYISGLRTVVPTIQETKITDTSPPGISIRTPPEFADVPQRLPPSDLLRLPPDFTLPKIDPSPPGFAKTTPPGMENLINIAHVTVAEQYKFFGGLIGNRSQDDMVVALAAGGSSRIDDFNKLVSETNLPDNLRRQLEEVIADAEIRARGRTKSIPTTDPTIARDFSDVIPKAGAPTQEQFIRARKINEERLLRSPEYQRLNARQRRHIRNIDEAILRRQMVAAASQAMVASQGFSPRQSNDPNVLRVATISSLAAVGKSTDIPRRQPAPAAPGTGGAADRPDTKPDVREDAQRQLADAITPSSRVFPTPQIRVDPRLPSRIIAAALIPAVLPLSRSVTRVRPRSVTASQTVTAPRPAPLFGTQAATTPQPSTAAQPASLTTTSPLTQQQQATAASQKAAADAINQLLNPTAVRAPSRTATRTTAAADAINQLLNPTAVRAPSRTATRTTAAARTATGSRALARTAATSPTVLPRTITRTTARPSTRLLPPVRGFKLPEGLKGKKLKPGEFPLVLTWAQGIVQRFINLQTGTTWSRAREPDKQTPQQSLRIVSVTNIPPPRRVIRMGIVNVIVTPTKLSFRKANPNLTRDRRFATRPFRISRVA
jgi:hypothetical protein